MRRSFCYKAKLSPSAIRSAEGQLALLCELHNAAIEERREAWKRRISITWYDQIKQLKDIRVDRPEFADIGAHVLQNALRRVDLAFKAFYRRSQQGKAPGYPRFRSWHRYDSLAFRAGSGWKLQGRRLTLQGIGTAKLRLSRPVEGRIRTVTLRRDRCGDWWVSFSCDGIAPNVLPETGQNVGVDVGLASFLTTSEGEAVANPRPLVVADQKMRRTQRAISKQRKDGSNRRKRVNILARQHRRVQRVRRDFHQKTALDLVRRYDIIGIEDLNVAGLKRGRLARSISDAGWSSFTTILRDKAENAGRLVIAVSPNGTSQLCSGCGATVKKTLADRIHSCSCGLVLGRDENAARNILARALGEAHRLASSPGIKTAA